MSFLALLILAILRLLPWPWAGRGDAVRPAAPRIPAGLAIAPSTDVKPRGYGPRLVNTAANLECAAGGIVSPAFSIGMPAALK